MEEKKKNGKVLYIITCIILIIAGFVTGFLLSGGADKKEEKKDTGEEKKEIASEIYNMKDGEIDLSNKELLEYVDIYKTSAPKEYFYELMSEGKTFNEIGDKHQTKLFLAYSLAKEEDFKTISCAELNVDADTILSLYYCGQMTDEMSKYYGENINLFYKAEKKNTTKAISGELIEKYYKMFFGDDGDFYHESFFTEYTRIGYSPKNNTYGQYGCQCGGIDAPIKETVTKAVKENGKVIITFKQEIGDSMSDDLVEKTTTLTLKWDEKTLRYVFDSRTVA